MSDREGGRARGEREREREREKRICKLMCKCITVFNNGMILTNVCVIAICMLYLNIVTVTS